MDIIRGIAIILMTVYHQGLVYSLDGRANHVSYFLGYLAAPFFLAVSGGGLWYHEHRYRWPIKMIVHGITLFLFAWMVDVIAHQRFNIDWDIFQLIGIGYAVFGAFNILGNNTRKYVALAVLIAVVCWVWSRLVLDGACDGGAHVDAGPETDEAVFSVWWHWT